MERYVVQDREQLWDVKSSGMTTRVLLIESSIRKTEDAIQQIERLLPTLGDQLWIAHRIEEESHRINASEVARAADVLHEVITASALTNSDEVDAILDRGVEQLSEILGGVR